MRLNPFKAENMKIHKLLRPYFVSLAILLNSFTSDRKSV